jgi:DNA mismatch repair protein MutS
MPQKKAWSVVEYINDTLGAKTLFATHYHELADLALILKKVKNHNFSVKEWNNEIIFLRKIVPGSSDRSYGIQVARLAGIPRIVLERAREVLANLEKTELDSRGKPNISRKSKGDVQEIEQFSLFDSKSSMLKQEIEKIDIDNTTPMQALQILLKIKKMAQED